MPLYSLRISLQHLTFRIPELLSISQVYDFPLRIISQELDRGILIVELNNDEDLNRLLNRGILIHHACRHICDAPTYDELHSELKSQLNLLDPYMDSSFKFSIDSINHRIPDIRQRKTIESFAYTGLRGPIKLSTPDVEFVVFEDYDYLDESPHLIESRDARDGHPRRIYLGIRMGDSKARPLVTTHAVKNRTYYGNTSMDAEMGFLMAGQTLAGPGKIVYDPFVGTGSLLYACAQWGAYVFGSDIDGRQMRGKGKGKDTTPGIFRAAAQYGVDQNILDCMTFDVTRNPMRRGGWVDAIITDPPYGVRAGAKRLGKKNLVKRPMREEPCVLPDGRISHLQPDYMPPFRPYELVNLTVDLILLARWLLVPNGRLVFFLPTVTEEYDAIDIPVVEGMRELKWEEGSVQDFGRWGRRLITMEKAADGDGAPPTFGNYEEEYERVKDKTPGHHNFRERYFHRFTPKKSMAESERPPEEKA